MRLRIAIGNWVLLALAASNSMACSSQTLSHETHAIRAVKNAGGRCFYKSDFREFPSTPWLSTAPDRGVLEVDLQLSSTRGTDELIPRLAHLKELRCLILGHTDISDAYAMHITAFSRLAELRLNSTQITDASLEQIAGIDSLTRLVLSNTKVSDLGLRSVGKMKALQDLDISHTHVTDAGINSLSGLQHLKKLHLQGLPLSDAAIDQIKSHRSLEVLDLSDTLVNDECIGQLATMTNLREVHLRGSRMTENGAAKLSEKLPNCVVRISP